MPKKFERPGRKGVPQKEVRHQAAMILNSGDATIRKVSKFAWKSRSRSAPQAAHRKDERGRAGVPV